MLLNISDKTVNRILLVAAIIALLSASILYRENLYPWSMWTDFIAGMVMLSCFVFRATLSNKTRLDLLLLSGTMIGIVASLQSPFASDGMLVLASVMAMSYANWSGYKALLVPIAAIFSFTAMVFLIGIGVVQFDSSDIPDLNSISLWLITALSLLLLAVVMGLAISELRRRLQNQINQLTQVNSQLFDAAYFDPVTKLANRVYFQQRVEEELQKQLPFRLFVLELSGIGLVRALHGQIKGDHCISLTGELILKHVQPDGLVARLDESRFALCSKTTDDDLLHTVLTQFVQSIAENEVLKNFGVDFRLALTEYPKDGASYIELMKNLDLTLQQSGPMPKERLQIFSAEMAKQINSRMLLKNKVQYALEHQCFYPVYQTKIESKTQKVVGVEGLARMKTLDTSFVSPADFIPLLHEEGWMEQFSHQMLDAVIGDIPHLVALYGKETKVAANISPPVFLSADFESFLLTSIQKHNVNPYNLVIEITEEVFSNDVSRIIECCRQLQQLGISVSLDDFGTGFSSLSFLKLMRFDEIKIDRSFLHDIEKQNHGLLLLSSMCLLAKELGSKVVIEGIESIEQYHLVKEMADEIQGFYFSRPIPLSQLSQSPA